MQEEIYINKKIQAWIDKLIDLFCLEDNKPLVILKPNKNNMCGYCLHAIIDHDSVITIGWKNGLRLTTLIHEFIHAMGYHHTYELNGYSDYRGTHTKDQYSKLVCKDLTGKKELIIWQSAEYV